jgi:hypothetical protein
VMGSNSGYLLKSFLLYWQDPEETVNIFFRFW